MADLKGKKLIFIGHDFKFINEYITHLEERGYPLHVSRFQHKGHDLVIGEELAKELETVDIVFCEWALGNAQALSHFKNKKFKLIVRAHAQEFRELRDETVAKINWENVDSVIFISPFLKETIESLIPQIINKSAYIPNYVANKKYKSEWKGKTRQFSLGMVGILPPLKRVDKALELISKLHECDHRYTLKIKSKTLDDLRWAKNNRAWRQWYDEIFKKFEYLFQKGVVELIPFSDDISAFYSSVDYILSMSDTEGSHQAIAEAMFSGCIPIIRNWSGAKDIYNSDVFDYISEMLEKIHYIDGSGLYEHLSHRCRENAIERFSQGTIFPKLNRCLGIN